MPLAPFSVPALCEAVITSKQEQKGTPSFLSWNSFPFSLAYLGHLFPEASGLLGTSGRFLYCRQLSGLSVPLHQVKGPLSKASV